MYDQIDLGKIQKSGFDLSNNVKGTGRIGRIIPTRCQETLPGDRMKGSSTAVVQFEPLAVPMLANMFVRQEHFYIPNRIVWKNWDKFFTGGEKLDFTTPPPSFSVKAALAALLERYVPFINYNVTTGCYLIADKNDQYYLFAKSSVTGQGSILQQITKSMIMGADLRPADTVDLTQCWNNVWHTYYNEVQSRTYTNDIMILFAYPYEDGYDSFSADLLAQNNFTNKIAYAISQSPDPYEAAIAHAVDKYISSKPTNLFANAATMPVMTDDMRELVHVLYDSYKQFLGVSSNLDYLSYARLTYSDFFYAIYVQYLTKLTSSQSAPVLYLNPALFSDQKMSVFALRANYMVWYNYYRDQLLELNAPEPSDADTVTTDELVQLLLPRQRCWSKDTFTTALTTTGTGNVVVPVVPNASVSDNYLERITHYVNSGADSSSAQFIQGDVCSIETSNGDKIEIPTRFISGLSKSKTQEHGQEYSYFSLDMLDACRRAQKWLQKALIYGNRPQDRLFTSWGVRSLDARLSLPECLATSSEIVQLSVNTNNTTIQDADGNTMSIAGDKSANAYGYDNGGDFNRFCEEHGLILSFLTILPEASYPYSVKRGHSRMDKFDYPTPEFATLGMDAVYESELCPCAVAGFDHGVFGYQGRYFDAKCNQDEEHGELQTSQNMFTFGRQWSPYYDDSRPKLNYQFVHCFPKLDMFVVEDSNADYFRYDIHHALAAERALPVCGMYL